MKPWLVLAVQEKKQNNCTDFCSFFLILHPEMSQLLQLANY